MASHFKFYSGVGETVPFNRRYQYPSQAHKTLKSTVKIPPKNGAVFASNGARLIRLEFPSQGYLNPLNTHIEFDLSLLASSDASNTLVRFQNNIQCIFNRVRILYGSLVIEDINDYNTIVRMLSEHTQYNANVVDQSSIAEGVGGQTMLMLTANTPTMVNTRYNFIQGIAAGNSATAIAPALNPRRYQVNLAAGLFSQDKLIPLKWMASQLAIELYLEDPVSCLEYGVYSSTQNYELDQVNIVAEMLEFDSSYDAAFLNGLKGDGVPLKLCSWHTFTFATTTAANYNLQIQERSRSVKAGMSYLHHFNKPFFSFHGTITSSNICK